MYCDYTDGRGQGIARGSVRSDSEQAAMKRRGACRPSWLGPVRAGRRHVLHVTGGPNRNSASSATNADRRPPIRRLGGQEYTTAIYKHGGLVPNYRRRAPGSEDSRATGISLVTLQKLPSEGPQLHRTTHRSLRVKSTASRSTSLVTTGPVAGSSRIGGFQDASFLPMTRMRSETPSQIHGQSDTSRTDVDSRL